MRSDSKGIATRWSLPLALLKAEGVQVPVTPGSHSVVPNSGEIADSQRSYAEGVTHHSPGSRVRERTLGCVGDGAHYPEGVTHADVSGM